MCLQRALPPDDVGIASLSARRSGARDYRARGNGGDELGDRLHCGGHKPRNMNTDGWKGGGVREAEYPGKNRKKKMRRYLQRPSSRTTAVAGQTYAQDRDRENGSITAAKGVGYCA